MTDAAEVLRRAKERFDRYGEITVSSDRPGTPERLAFTYLVRAEWDFDRAIALAESEEHD